MINNKIFISRRSNTKVIYTKYIYSNHIVAFYKKKSITTYT